MGGVGAPKSTTRSGLTLTSVNPPFDRTPLLNGFTISSMAVLGQRLHQFHSIILVFFLSSLHLLTKVLLLTASSKNLYWVLTHKIFV